MTIRQSGVPSRGKDGNAQPKPARRLIDAALLRHGFEKLIQDTYAALKRYTPEQIDKSKVLTARKTRLSFYEECLKDFDVRTANNIRTAKRKTYLIGVYCPACTYTARVTRKWLDVAPLACPNPDCELKGEPMEESEVVKARDETAAELADTLQTFEAEHRAEQKDCVHLFELDDGWLNPANKGKRICVFCSLPKEEK